MASWIGKLYPSTKFLMVVLVTLLSMFTANYVFQYMLFALILLLSLLSGTLKEFLVTFIKSIFIIVLFIFMIQVYLIRNPDSQQIWQFIYFSQAGFFASVDMTARIMAISSSIIWFFQVTSTKDIIYALEKARVPKQVTFVIASTIQLVPQMSKLSKTITDAQKARGIETEGNLWIRMKAFFPMMGPLVLSSIQQTEERVLTLESRGFSSRTVKTSVYEIKKRKSDYFVLAMCFVGLVGYMVWRING